MSVHNDVEVQDVDQPILVNRLWTFMLSKKPRPIPSDEERKPYQEFHSNPLSRLFFWWMFPIMFVGYKRTLVDKDMYILDNRQKVDVIYQQFKKNLNRYIDQGKATHAKKKSENVFKVDQVIFIKALYRTFFWEFTLGVICLTISDLTAVTTPLVQKKLITFVEEKALGFPIHNGAGVGYAICVSIMSLLSVLMFTYAFYMTSIVGAKIRGILTRLILDKAMSINAKGEHTFGDSKVQSLISTDLNRIDLALPFLPFGIAALPAMAVCIGLLIYNIGASALSGIAILFLLLIALGVGAPLLFKMRNKMVIYTDDRIQTIKELLTNFKMIKFYSWETSYEDRIHQTRTIEMNFMYKMQMLRNGLVSFAITMPNYASIAAFCTFYAISDGQTPANLFSSLSFFSVLSELFLYVPFTMIMGIDLTNGLKRIGELYTFDNRDESKIFIEQVPDAKYSVKLDHAFFEWETFDDNEKDEELDSDKTSLVKSQITENNFPGLIDINLEIKKGEFVVVIGSIGSGKTSLLMAMSGFMERNHGTVYHSGTSLFCGAPWVQNATVRQNITFGLPYNKAKYDEIVEACCLLPDFEQFIGGDMTEVGERGITLSGGQKARINLARSVYADKDIIFMDDVLSAVDAKVGKHIVDKCFLGILKYKTRILATHHLHIADKADRMIFVNGDGSIEIGNYDELGKTNNKINDLFRFHDHKMQNEKDIIGKVEPVTVVDIEKEKVNYEFSSEVKITEDEERAVNALGLHIYTDYINIGLGRFKFSFPMIFISLMILSTFCDLFSNTWLTYWLEDKWADRGKSFYMGLYIMFTFLYSIFLTAEFLMLSYLCTTAAKYLNLKATSRILHVPMSFMDTNPLGRILNRFTKDTDVLDNSLVDQIRMTLIPLCNIVGTIILCIIYIPWFAIAIPVMLFIFITITEFYQASAREIKRLEAIKRSFVYSHFNETIDGKLTIRAFGFNKNFCEGINPLIDTQNESYFAIIAIQRWLVANLSIISLLIVLVISLCCVFNVFNISASQSGLLLTYVLSISPQLSMLMSTLTIIENEFNSAERLNYYAFDLVQEKPFEIPENDPNEDWPVNNAIEFKNVSMKYRPELPYVLKNVSLLIKSNEKIGVCGRTGAGKSTIMTCLYRLTEFEGEIDIDGVNISNLGLHKLRSKLSIIPQDPSLFIGDIRHNLDPFKKFDDDTLWNVLCSAGLIEKDELKSVRDETDKEKYHKFHLLRSVEQGGSNFSLGERQLLALARTIVMKTTILIMDEATSSVDYKTDSKIQESIAKNFNDCTILCIAHRLKTILKYDRIIVMEGGEIVEFDTPKDLFNANGTFREMCNQSEITEANFE